MIITGIVVAEGEEESYKQKCIQARNILYHNIAYVAGTEGCTDLKFRQAVLSTYVQYYFLDTDTNDIYKLQVSIDNNVVSSTWLLDKHLCLKDDDGEYLYVIRSGRVILKEKLRKQVVVRETTTDLNATFFNLLLLANYDEIRLTNCTQLISAPDPTNTMAAIVDNSQFGLTASFCYKFYPNNDPNYNTVEVTNIITKSATTKSVVTESVITVAYDSLASITFNGVNHNLTIFWPYGLLLFPYGDSGKIDGVGVGVWRYQNIIPYFYYWAYNSGNYKVSLNFPGMRLSHAGNEQRIEAYVLVNGQRKDLSDITTTAGSIDYSDSITINDVTANSTIQFGIYYTYLSPINGTRSSDLPIIGSGTIQVERISTIGS